MTATTTQRTTAVGTETDGGGPQPSALTLQRRTAPTPFTAGRTPCMAPAAAGRQAQRTRRDRMGNAGCALASALPHTLCTSHGHTAVSPPLSSVSASRHRSRSTADRACSSSSSSCCCQGDWYCCCCCCRQHCCRVADLVSGVRRQRRMLAAAQGRGDRTRLHTGGEGAAYVCSDIVRSPLPSCTPHKHIPCTHAYGQSRWMNVYACLCVCRRVVQVCLCVCVCVCVYVCVCGLKLGACVRV